MSNYNPFISTFQELGIEVYNISHQYNYCTTTRDLDAS